VDFFRYDRVASKILGLEGGTSYLTHLIGNYDKDCRIYRKVPSSPVIVLIDSDSGATPILKLVKNKFAKDIKLTAPDPFHHLCRNLYLVMTPVRSGVASSCIEDLFELTLLATLLGGKSFNPTNFDSSATEYGKFYFAEYVVRPKRQSIDVTGFSPLLVRLAAACADYTTKQVQNAALPHLPAMPVSSVNQP
jgi:RNA-directed DNA polymerase